MSKRATLRASDADRERVAEQLRTATTEGRLAPDEFDERLGHALTAKTYGELDMLVADLPSSLSVERRVPRPPVRRSRLLSSPLAVVLALVAVMVVLSAIGTAFVGHAHSTHYGFGGFIWLIWVALALRLFWHRRGRAR